MSPSPAGVPQRGDIVWIDRQPQAGPEQAARRPALVLSPASYNGKVGLALLCPVTSRLKGNPFEVVLPEDLSVTGAVLADQVKSLDWRAHRAEVACVAPPGVVRDVQVRIRALLEDE